MKDKISDILTINHYVLTVFPYWTDELMSKWQEKVTTLLMSVNEEMTQVEFYKELMKLAAILNDGHTLVYLPKEIKEEIGYFPVELGLLEEKLVILSGNGDVDKYLYQPIKNINGISAEAYLHMCSEYGWAHHNEFSMGMTQLSSSFFFEGEELKVMFETGQTLHLPYLKERYYPKKEIVEYISQPFDILYESEEMVILKVASKIVVKLNHFMSENIVPEFFCYVDDYLSAEELIFDVRDNFGGNSGIANEIAQAFFDESIEMEKASRQVVDSEKIAIASMILYGMDSEVAKKTHREEHNALNHQSLKIEIEKNDLIKYMGVLTQVPVKILQNRMTYSSGENFIINFDNKKRATLIGETTAGSTGQPAWLSLKTGGMFMVTAKKVEYPNGKKHHNLGIEPDVFVSETLTSKRNKIDAILNYALEQK